MFDTGAIAIAEALVSVQRRAHLSHRLAIRGQVCAVLILVRVDAVVVKHVPHAETECPGQHNLEQSIKPYWPLLCAGPEASAKLAITIEFENGR